MTQKAIDSIGQGSSPLARGLHRRGPAAACTRGIIPARAGFTVWVCGLHTWPGDHPRSRGVYPSEALRANLSAGSSPLARGLPSHCPAVAADFGIIPARAGFTGARPGSAGSQPDHPRSRGVYGWCGKVAAGGVGSSPLARGLHCSVLCALCCSGIIPARAGFTSAGWTVIPSSSGSSPLARGLLPRAPLGLLRAGIIPARAGFTGRSPGPDTGRRDHPRSRGVYPRPPDPGSHFTGSSPLARGLLAPLVCFSFFNGSSPLARGLLHHHGVDEVPARIIPARAGFTCPVPDVPLVIADHPRSRGVYPAGNGAPHDLHGSSPLARGLRTEIGRLRAADRIIPARAGFTCVRCQPCMLCGDHPRSRGVYSCW